MDNEQFLQKLTELADWHRPQVGPSGGTSVLKRKVGPKPQFSSLDEPEEEEVLGADGPNETVGPVICELKSATRPCEDCGKTVKDRRVLCRYHDDIVPHWREQCRSCMAYRDPFTGEFTLKGTQNVWNTFKKYCNKIKNNK